MEKTKLYLVVLLIRVIYTGMQIIIKAAFDGGMNTAVFVFYRQLIATLILVPVALVVERCLLAIPRDASCCHRAVLFAFNVRFISQEESSSPVILVGLQDVHACFSWVSN